MKMRLSSVAFALGFLFVLPGCGKSPRQHLMGASAADQTKSAISGAGRDVGGGIGAVSGNGSRPGAAGEGEGDGDGQSANSSTSLQLNPKGGSWTTQDVIPLPPTAIVTAFSRVLEVKPVLSNEERFALGEIQMDFRYGRNVRLTPILGVPPLNYMQTLRSVAYRVCKAQVEGEFSKSIPQRWFPNASAPTAQSLALIYAALTGSHKVTPEILEYTKSVSTKFNAVPAGFTD